MAACYARIVKGRMCRLVGVAVIVVLSGTPALAAVCAELCGLGTAPASMSTHCSKHGTAHTAVVVGHEPGCCGRVHLPLAVATKLSRAEAPSISVVLALGSCIPYPAARPEPRALPPGSSGPPALARAPLILRI